jgi:ubiquinone/menaquinone biosynthesis C-methylase UbiE
LKQCPHSRPELVRPERYKQVSSAISYDKHIHAVNAGRRLSRWLEIRALKRALSRIEGEKVLDGPCGTGRINKILSVNFKTVVSLDSSEAMLFVHQRNTEPGMLCCGDIFNLSFRDDYFDWTVSYRLFHHMQNREDRISFLKSIARVSRQGIIFTAWINTPISRRRGSRRCSLDRKETASLILDAKLRLVNIDYVSWPFQPKCLITCKKPIMKRDPFTNAVNP